MGMIESCNGKMLWYLSEELDADRAFALCSRAAFFREAPHIAYCEDVLLIENGSGRVGSPPSGRDGSRSTWRQKSEASKALVTGIIAKTGFPQRCSFRCSFRYRRCRGGIPCAETALPILEQNQDFPPTPAVDILVAWLVRGADFHLS